MELSSLSGYGKPPWVFKGSALYQLHLVKTETARAFIPKEFKLMEAFGYTLGGFFLANYVDSPPGKFDELVVIAGTVGNPWTACAWAAKVLVNSDEACAHGRKEFGLPSQVAKFTKRITTLAERRRSQVGGTDVNIQVKEMMRDADTAMDFCSIKLNASDQGTRRDSKTWIGLPIKMSLPSYSGLTEDNPHLLKYSCEIECRLRVVLPTKISGPYAKDVSSKGSGETELDLVDSEDYKTKLSISVMLSKPILALEFNCLKMKVESPTTVVDKYMRKGSSML